MQNLGRGIQSPWLPQRRGSGADNDTDDIRSRQTPSATAATPPPGTAPTRRFTSLGIGESAGVPSSSAPNSPLVGIPAVRGFVNPAHSRSSSVSSSTAMASPSLSAGEQTQEAKRTKTNQLLQNFFMKAAMVVLHERMELTPVYSTKSPGVKIVNKWFGIEQDDTDMFSRELRLWRHLDAYDPRQSPPPPLIVETYLDWADMSPTHTLVILDANGQRSKVGDGQGGGPMGSLRPEVVLERWKVTLGPSSGAPFNEELAGVYKRGIVLFRTIFTYIHIMPAFRLLKRIQKGGTRTNGLKILCRVRNSDELDDDSIRALEMPLARDEQGDPAQDYSFGSVECPVGTLSVEVRYRQNCDFRVDDSESLLSSHFINEDELFFTPSLPSNQSAQSGLQARFNQDAATNDHRHQSGSAPRSGYPGGTIGGTPGSRPTTGYMPSSVPSSVQPLSSIPLSRIPSGERRAAHLRTASPLSGSPYGPLSSNALRESKGSLRSDAAGVGRRPSVSFNPFKSPSLSGSPSTGNDHMAALRSAGSRVSTGSTTSAQRMRTPVSATVPAAQNLNRRSLPPDYTPPLQPSSASPRPQSMKFSSSFKDRKPRYSKGDDDGNSSGRASYASSAAAPFSGGFNDEVANTLSRDEKHLSDFMAMLEGADVALRSFDPKPSDSSANKPAATGSLSKFRSMQESHSHLTDSLLSSSSILKPPTTSSASSSSRQISHSHSPSLGLHASAASSGSSPGNQISPHTPHAPLVRSRLSEGLTVEYPPTRYQHRPRPEKIEDSDRTTSSPAGTGTSSSPPTSTAPVTSPLDIPSPPRPVPVPDFRRPNSFNQQQQHFAVEEDVTFDSTGGYGQGRQSLSLGSMGAMAPMSMSRLAQLQLNDPPSSSTGSGSGNRTGPSARRDSTSSSTANSPIEKRVDSTTASRFSGGTGSGGSSERTVRPHPEQRGSSGLSSGLGRFGIADDEEMLFTINDIAGRRSLEDSGRGSTVGSGSGSGSGAVGFGRGLRR